MQRIEAREGRGYSSAYSSAPFPIARKDDQSRHRLRARGAGRA
jgi:hypothetical protein